MSCTEIKKGMNITVDSWEGGKDHSWCGDPLKVLAVDGKFIAVNNIKSPFYGTFQLDTTRCNVRQVSDEYVKAFTKKEPK